MRAIVIQYNIMASTLRTSYIVPPAILRPIVANVVGVNKAKETISQTKFRLSLRVPGFVKN